jgi:hypothetical protein
MSEAAAATRAKASFTLDTRFSEKELRHLRDRFLVLTHGRDYLDRCVRGELGRSVVCVS